MKNKLITLTLWVLLIFCCVAIFYFSAQNGVQSSQISQSVSQAFITDANPTTINTFETIVRKLAHIFEYFVLAVLAATCFYRILPKPAANQKKVRGFVLAFIACVAFALTDEFHQLFVGGRSGQITDVFIDTIGIFFGIVAVYLVTMLIAKHKKIC